MMLARLRRHTFLLLALLIFALAVFARAGALKNYVTPDEPVWVLRSLNFSQALARGDWAATAQMGHPGVTTMWLGSLGIAVKRAVDPIASTDAITWLSGLPSLAPENAEAFKRLGVFLTFARLPVIVVNALGVVMAVWLLRRLFDQRVAVIGGLLLAVDPFVAGLSGLLHVDSLLATFMLLSVLTLLIGIKDQGSGIRWFALSGAFAALAFLSKSPALFLLPFALLVLFFAVLTHRLSLKRAAGGGLSLFIVACALFILLYPAMWVEAVGTFNGIVGLAAFLSANPVRPTFFEGQYVLNHGAAFYPTALIYRLTPVVMIGLIVAVAAVIISARTTHAASRRDLKTNLALLAFSLLFIIFITPVAKKYDRYLLPALVMLIPIAAWGYGQIRLRGAAPLVSIAAAAIGLAYWPYLLMHYNLLLGGPAAAQQHLAVGWGEGLGAAANWINAQPNGLQATTATGAVPSFAPIFSGRSALLNEQGLELSDYYVVTLSERQLDPEVLPRLEQRGSIIHTLSIGNAPAAWVLINDRAEKQADQLAQADPATDVVVTMIDLPVTRLYHGAAPHVVLPRQITPTQIEQTLNDLSTRYRRLWFVWSEAASSVVQAQVQQWLAQTALEAQSTQFGATQVAVYDLQPGRLGRLESLQVQFNGNFALLGMTAAPRGRAAQVALRWQALTPASPPYSVTLQLIDARGAVWQVGGGAIQDEAQFPAPRWYSGQVAEQIVDLDLPDEAPPGRYRVRLSVDQADGQRVGLFSAAGTFSGTAPALVAVDLPPLDKPLTAVRRRIEYPFTHQWGDQIEVLGFNSGPGVVINGDLWTVDVVWRSRAAGLPALGVLWEVRDQAGQKMFSTRLPLSAYPTPLWRKNEVIASRYTLRFPVNLTRADYQVYLGVTAPDGSLLPGGLFKPFDVRLLERERSFTPPVSPTLNVTFDDPAIKLIGAQFPAGVQRPGSPLPVTVYWQAGTTTAESYTVFVRLESLTGQVLTQIDSAPQGGGMPTASWATGQFIEDVYPLTIPPDTPPGAYRVIVGLYNPLDGAHLIDTATGDGKVALEPVVVVR